MTMAMLVETLKERKQAGLGSPGLDEIRWLKPVYPGDTLSVETEIVDKKRSSSRPEMGSFRSNVRVYNQDGVVVMSMKSIGLIRVREAEAAA